MAVAVATFTYEGHSDEAFLDDIAHLIGDDDVTVAALPGRGYTVTIWVDGSNGLAYSLQEAWRVVKALDQPVGASVVTEEEYERVAYAPTLPQILSAAEAAEVLGVTRQRVHQLSREHSAFPAPLFTPRTGPLWEKTAIEAFGRVRSRRSGRPVVAPDRRAS